ncbi:tRNA (adenosine(37)-N6)-threonylcarbamoyltransferase complex ATPase subunit type 1 TsaE [Aliibacillus thermotolerans]|uniref:tRNA threonylcarbamoyladenosine biosynthesis protein TsaE n=1 Tax=Aliibacillus thermotolerans TaxID=1834418 RepID=A0ABW0U6W7_9BACI|nr:tRNA (adenosine(37)-N6)-threonylcarbamoyltransferase complex ATPase subunit type 1 TsaE [Aliibacillus thermotolerans]MDA3130460.1 tRNA (adenosine(37)-N6)-threonylcarbamoyltransferase complex ATPase subunit type 1 TsaE [Aliibacillus thermotolerans]
MATFHFIVTSPEETLRFAKKIGEKLQSGDIITLDGGLGAGKTHFTKGIAAALHVTKTVNSPTFTIIKEYDGRLPLYHMDVYRIESEEADELGLEEYFEGKGVCVIEWAEKITEFLPKERLEIYIERHPTEERHFYLHAHGTRWKKLCEELEEDENISN